jgi:hypothetical protein
LGIDAVSASEGACVLSAAVVSSGPEEAQPVSWLRARPAARLKEIETMQEDGTFDVLQIRSFFHLDHLLLLLSFISEL